MKVNGFLLKSALVASLGGLLFGFDTAVISGTEQALQRLYQGTYEDMANIFHVGFLGSTGFWHGFTTASALIGTILGAWLVFKPSDIFGRKKTLFVLGLLYFISAAGSAFAWNWYSFVIFRFIGGLAVGGSSVAGPIYIAEISPAKKRGGLVALMQFNIVSGILLAYLSNWWIGSMGLGETEWRWMFGAEAFPAIAFSILILGNSQSPRWLMAKGREAEAVNTLHKLGVQDVQTEANEIKEALANKIHEDFFIKKDSLEQFENNDKNKLITHLSHQIDDLHDNLLDTLNNKKGTILGESSETGKSEENDHSDGLNHLEESGHSEEDGHLDESSHSETSHPLHPLSEEDVSISQIHKQVSNHPVTQTNQDSTQSINQSNPNTSSTQASSLNKEPFISNKQNQKYKLNEIQSNVNSIIQKYKGLLDPKNNLIVN